MKEFLESKTFLAVFGGLSLFRFISVVLGWLFYGYGLTIFYMFLVLTILAQTVILFGILVRNSNTKGSQNGIRLAFLIGLVGNFMLAVGNFIDRRSMDIPLNPLEVFSPLIAVVFPIMNFFDIPMGGVFLIGFWIPNLILYYALFIATFFITFKKDSPVADLVSQDVNNLTSIESSVRKAMSNVATWTVRIPGQPESPVDTATLQSWAKSGFLRPDTMVTEVSTGYAYQARQIPGVFSSKSYVTALLLSFFFGVFGVDRFYLGHVGVGLGKLFTFGGLGIWALIDFILIATKNIKDSQGVPLA
jgi:hypothetical protein